MPAPERVRQDAAAASPSSSASVLSPAEASALLARRFCSRHREAELTLYRAIAVMGGETTASVQTLAQVTGVSIRTAYRLLRSLSEAGYLVRVPTAGTDSPWITRLTRPAVIPFAARCVGRDGRGPCNRDISGDRLALRGTNALLEDDDETGLIETESAGTAPDPIRDSPCPDPSPSLKEIYSVPSAPHRAREADPRRRFLGLSAPEPAPAKPKAAPKQAAPSEERTVSADIVRYGELYKRFARDRGIAPKAVTDSERAVFRALAEQHGIPAVLEAMDRATRVSHRGSRYPITLLETILDGPQGAVARTGRNPLQTPALYFD